MASFLHPTYTYSTASHNIGDRLTFGLVLIAKYTVYSQATRSIFVLILTAFTGPPVFIIIILKEKSDAAE